MSAREPAHDVVQAAVERGLSVATGESLTAGLLCARIADVPGASAVLRGGVVTYAVELKASVLGVDPARLAEFGPVDPVVAEQMALGAARVCGAGLGLSTTGVAGPDAHGGHEPGTVYLGWALNGRSGHRLLHLPGDRAQIRERTVQEGLSLALEVMAG